MQFPNPTLRRSERRERILDAAWTCFHHNGLHATTMDHIICASGLSTGVVYNYFPSKEALIEAAVTTSLLGLRVLLAPRYSTVIPRRCP